MVPAVLGGLLLTLLGGMTAAGKLKQKGLILQPKPKKPVEPIVLEFGKPTQAAPINSPTPSPLINNYQATARPQLADYSPPPTQSPTAQYIPPASQAPVSQYQTPSLDEDIVRKMINVYGGEKAPLHNYAKILADATQYDFWKQNPELLALIPHLETSSGRDMTRPKEKPNSLMNYGIFVPQINELFANMSPEEVLQRSLKEIGETGNTYKNFRTGRPLTDDELNEFGRLYVGPEDTTYGKRLIEGRKHVRESLGWR